MIEDDLNLLESLRPSDEELDLGTSAARAFMEHCKWCRASATERSFRDGAGGEWVVTVEWRPAKDAKAN